MYCLVMLYREFTHLELQLEASTDVGLSCLLGLGLHRNTELAFFNLKHVVMLRRTGLTELVFFDVGMFY